MTRVKATRLADGCLESTRDSDMRAWHGLLAQHHKVRRDIEFEDIDLIKTDDTYHLVKYLDKAEVLDQWVKESQAMYNEAAAICEDMGWSIYDANGGLWYKAGLGGVEVANPAALKR